MLLRVRRGQHVRVTLGGSVADDAIPAHRPEARVAQDADRSPVNTVRPSALVPCRTNDSAAPQPSAVAPGQNV
ncbi:hypothetical protein GCM10022416_24760 [Actinomadura keratinilytica]|uniref:Uncharacterized protein n=1 Tax=Actinomadura keratinilytica TaxID=547461 RepID=A0ABP7YNH9_9ACTN